MNNHLKAYLDILAQTSPNAVESVKKTVSKLVPEHIESFSHQEHIRGLLLGEVQSGKTSQILGLIAAAADVDEGFKIFVLLTTDNTALQQQTLQRSIASMDTFNVCDEHDEMRFMQGGVRKPSLIVLKKNSSILKKWRNILGSSSFSKGFPIFIVDDEADAASLNTKVNKDEQSAINNHLEAMIKLFTSSFYLQVTATPQSLFLLTEESGWKPSFVHYFPPGKNYLGGEFFYTKPKPYTYHSTEDNELQILLESTTIAEGLKVAIETFLITCAHLNLSKDSTVCNFLIHPSSRIDAHEKIKNKVIDYINYLFNNLNSKDISTRLKDAWVDLQRSKPQIVSFEDTLKFLSSKPEVKVTAMNSSPQNDSHLSYDNGLNVVIGGNSLGRGVTFKCLQTIYYCRSAKIPQADTFWQHCRMFGYDRDPLLMRLFMPEALFNLFSEINDSNYVLIKQIEENKFDEIQIVTSGKTKPTRKNVIDQDKYDYVVGGVNYFPPSPDQDNKNPVDKLLEKYDEDKKVHDVTTDELVKILAAFKSDPTNNWSIESFQNALLAVKAQKGNPNLGKLIVRRNRDIKRGTGTLLSPDDRRLGTDIENLPVLTIYRLTGLTEKGWNGEPFWIPNIKLPSGKVFHRIIK
jgi:hypothetical protein